MPALTKTEVCRLLPHAGSMCLLDEVERWDNSRLKRWACMLGCFIVTVRPRAKDRSATSVECGTSPLGLNDSTICRPISSSTRHDCSKATIVSCISSRLQLGESLL